MHQLRRTYNLTSEQEFDIAMAISGNADCLTEEISKLSRPALICVGQKSPLVERWTQGIEAYRNIIREELESILSTLAGGGSLEEYVNASPTRINWTATRLNRIYSIARSTTGPDRYGDKKPS